MSEEKKLGKIEHVKFGIDGYQGAMIGIHFTFSGDGWGVADSSHAAWDAEMIEWSTYCKWTEEERNESYAKIMRYISKLLKEAKVDDVNKLKNIPVEVTFENNILKEWRILTEVL